MIKVEKIVNILKQDEKVIEEICRSLGISKLTAKVLYNRGITDTETCKEFLDSTLDRLHDPFLFTDMDKAIERIIEGINKKESIWIYGDYDVDGVTSTSVMKLFFSTLDVDVKYYIPDRLSEGYGLNKNAIEYIHNEGGQLIITVDCGISAIEESEYCKELGIDIIITDHHQCGEELPKAVAVINPNRKDSKYPFDKLAGVGVAFKVIEALAKKLNKPMDLNELLPIVAVGTVADVVSLTGENRIIVKNGLRLMEGCTNHGLKALLRVTGLENKKVTSGHIGFVLGPRINATGRVGSAKDAVVLLTSKNEEETLLLAQKLNEENIERQKIEGDILREAEELIKKHIDIDNEKVLVLAKEGWHPGVIGIVSSRITEKYYRPSVIIALDGDEGKGSARSISSFNIYEGLYECRDLFNNFGGHSQAAGLSISKGNIAIFRQKINAIADNILTEQDIIPEIIVDTEIETDDIRISTINELSNLEPFGIDNPSPLFIYRDTKIKVIKQVGQGGSHLKLVVGKKGIEVDSIGFRLGNRIDGLAIDDTIDMIVSMELNDFSGQAEPQFNVKDIRGKEQMALDMLDSYYSSLSKRIFNECRLENENSMIVEHLPSSKDRLKYAIELLSNEDKILVLINNLYNAQDLVAELSVSGRHNMKRVSISFSVDKEEAINSIVINPIFENLNLSSYDKVVLFDLCFEEDHYSYLFDAIGQQLEYIYKTDDIDKNILVLDELAPKKTELRQIYKTLSANKSKIFKLNMEQYLMFVEKTTELRIQIHKLIVILHILREGELIDFKLDGNTCFVKTHKLPKNKINIEELPTFRFLCSMKDYMTTLKSKYY